MMGHSCLGAESLGVKSAVVVVYDAGTGGCDYVKESPWVTHDSNACCS